MKPEASLILLGPFVTIIGDIIAGAQRVGQSASAGTQTPDDLRALQRTAVVCQYLPNGEIGQSAGCAFATIQHMMDDRQNEPEQPELLRCLDRRPEMPLPLRALPIN